MAAGLHDAHDRLFKYAFGPPEAMAVQLRRMLPPELLAHLDTSTLRPAPTERTNSRLGGHTSDLHFTIDYVEDGLRFEIHLAVEHQSNPDHGAPLRFLAATSGTTTSRPTPTRSPPAASRSSFRCCSPSTRPGTLRPGFR
jgi:hypothetical protein